MKLLKSSYTERQEQDRNNPGEFVETGGKMNPSTQPSAKSLALVHGQRWNKKLVV